MYLNLVFVVYLGSERPFERMQPALMLYVNEDLLRGKEATHQNISVRFHTSLFWLCIPPLIIV